MNKESVLKSDYLLELKKLCQDSDITAMLNSDYMRSVSSAIAKSSRYEHGQESSVFVKKIYNYYKTQGHEPKDMMKRYAYSLCTCYLSLLNQGLSWCNEGNYFIGAYGAKGKVIPSVTLTSYGKRQALENMDGVLLVKEGKIVRRWHTFEYETGSDKMKHIIGIPPAIMKDGADDIVGVYAIIEFKDGKKDIIFVDHETIKRAEEDALAYCGDKRRLNRTRNRIPFIKRLPYIYGYKVYFDSTKMTEGIGTTHAPPLKGAEAEAEEDGEVIYNAIVNNEPRKEVVSK